MRPATLSISALVLWLSAGLALAAGPRDPETHFFDQTLGDLPEELALAREEGKRGLLIFFEMEECPFCHRMKQTVLNQPTVQDFYKAHFVILRMNSESAVEITDPSGKITTEKDFFAAVTRNRAATPVFAFFDLEGELVARYTGATTGPEEFLLLGEYAAEGIYEDMSFSRYKREKRRHARAD